MTAEITRRGFTRAGLAGTFGLAAGAESLGSEAKPSRQSVKDKGGQSSMTGADLVARLLKAHGVPFLSTLCGNGLDPLLAACQRHDLRLVDVRNEQAAGYMADVVGRLTGRIGACSASSGIAHVNALTGLTNAHFDGAPVLLITGASESRTEGMGNFQDLDHAGLARPICKMVQRVNRPDRIALAVHEAIAAAESGRPGPVNLCIPDDVLRAPVDPVEAEAWLGKAGSDASAREATADGPRSTAEPELVREALDLLARSRRPLLIAGSGVFYANGGEALRRLAKAVGSPVLTPIWDRGSVNRPMPEFLGVIGAASGGPDLLSDSDVVVLAGSLVDYRVGYMRRPAISSEARVIRIDCDPAQIGQGVSADVGLLGDPGLVLSQLCDDWQQRGLTPRAEWLREARKRNAQFRIRWGKRPSESPMTGHHLVEALRPLITDDLVFLVDGGNIGQWAHVLLWDRYPGDWLTCGSSGVVGWGLPGAIGARLLNPDRPVLLLSGDGAIGFTITELETAVRHQVPVVVVIADDQAWGIVASGQKKALGGPIASILGPVDYAKVARGFGARGVTAETPEEVTVAAREALSASQPTVIEVPIALLGPTDVV